ncbi:sister chromatid cohesion protein eso1 [Apiospora hydei]|uniref:Sister chromatid cohesion protein eso1 n=1 Tax=Apiospora hydei TaxID=1337664 RepID=A0ABR1VGU8_9PEZI
MPSSPIFQGSSPGYGTGRRKSQFTYRQLGLLTSYSTSSPLRVISHIDLDAFYAQCEMVRLGTPEDQPLAVQQWQGLIAVNYPARKFGIGRHSTVTDAKKMCPQLIAQHVATWKEGDEKWAYHEDAASHIGTHKVSLDPYRLQSRRILALIKESLPANMQKVEKASIDEVFVDLSAQIHSILLQRFPELANPPPYDDPTEKLPLPPISALDWQADALVDLDDAEAEADDPDWDDVAILIGSEIVRDIRAEVRRKIGYTCSAGIASNKMLSKLGSGHKKPNQQTVIRNRAVQHFLSDMKVTKIRNLGGKLGEQVTSVFETDSIKVLLAIPVEQMKAKLGEDTGIWLYNTIRGIDTSEMAQDLCCRYLFAIGGGRGPGEQAAAQDNQPSSPPRGQTRSRQNAIPQGKILDETTLFELAKNLMNQIALEGRIWPCANLSLSVAGFEDGVTGNMGIGGFLVKGEEAKSLMSSSREASVDPHSEARPEKRRRTDNPGIQRFLARASSSSDVNDGGTEEAREHQSHQTVANQPPPEHDASLQVEQDASTTETKTRQLPITDYTCSRCHARLGNAEAHQSHLDWHFAKDLQEEERGSSTLANRPAGPRNQKPSASTSRQATRGSGKKQSKLNFG